MKKLFYSLLAAGMVAGGLSSCSSTSTESSDPAVTTEGVIVDTTNLEMSTTLSADSMVNQPTGNFTAFDSTNFGIMAASFDLLEIMTSEEALAKAKNPEVRNFAQQMLTVHKSMAKEIKALSNQKAQRLPTELLPDHQEMYTKFQNDQVKDFDKAYMELQAKAHLKTVDLFEEAAEDHPDPELRAYATRHIRNLRSQWGMAKKTKDLVD